MSNFIVKDDYKSSIRTYRLDQILEAPDEDEEAILNDAEFDALAFIDKHMADKYDMVAVFAKTGNARNRVILRWAKVLVIYYIYERVPDENVPERVVKNYNEVMSMLKRIENGEAGVPGLPPKTVTTSDGDTANYTKRRFGSNEARSHDGLSPRFKG